MSLPGLGELRSITPVDELYETAAIEFESEFEGMDDLRLGMTTLEGSVKMAPL